MRASVLTVTCRCAVAGVRGMTEAEGAAAVRSRLQPSGTVRLWWGQPSRQPPLASKTTTAKVGVKT